MANLTIRARTWEDREAIEALKAATCESTASKAIWHAIENYPSVEAELGAQKEKYLRTRRLISEYRLAERRVAEAERWRKEALAAMLEDDAEGGLVSQGPMARLQ